MPNARANREAPETVAFSRIGEAAASLRVQIAANEGGSFTSVDSLRENSTPAGRTTDETPSLNRRYVSKVSSGIVAALTSFLSQMIVPRTLGPAAYGDFSFLAGFFAQCFDFLDGGTSTAFYARLSQRPADHGILRFYWGYLGLIGVVVASVIAFVELAAWNEALWPNQKLGFVWLAAGLAWLALANRVTGSIVDAYGLTVRGESVRSRLAVVNFLLLVALLSVGGLHLFGYFCWSCLAHCLAILILGRLLVRAGRSIISVESLGRAQIASYARQFASYSLPLVASTVLALIVGLGDRWLLQVEGGSIEQGYFMLSSQIGALCFLFTGALTPLLLREFASASASGERRRLRAVFSRWVPALFAVSAFFGLFVSVQAENIVAILGGNQFEGARIAVRIMALYPIHQTYGQMAGTLLLATGQTRLYSAIAAGAALASIPLTIWLIGPERWGCLDWKASGQAIKMVLVQLLGVETILWSATRQLDLSFVRFLQHQIVAVAIFFGLAIGASAIAATFCCGPLPSLLAGGVLYAVGTLGVAVAFPSLFAMSRRGLRNVAVGLWRSLRAGVKQ